MEVHPLPPSFAVYEWKWRSPLSPLTPQGSFEKTAQEADEERYALLMLRRTIAKHPDIDIPEHEPSLSISKMFVFECFFSSMEVRQVLRVCLSNIAERFY